MTNRTSKEKDAHHTCNNQKNYEAIDWTDDCDHMVEFTPPSISMRHLYEPSSFKMESILLHITDAVFLGDECPKCHRPIINVDGCRAVLLKEPS